jgi:hypothetical protein
VFASFGDGAAADLLRRGRRDDLEAKDAVELFVGFGGVAEREVRPPAAPGRSSCASPTCSASR